MSSESRVAASREPASAEALLKIAHDLNNVLTIVGGELDLLGPNADAAAREEALVNLRAAIKRGAELVRALTKLA